MTVRTLEFSLDQDFLYQLGGRRGVGNAPLEDYVDGIISIYERMRYAFNTPGDGEEVDAALLRGALGPAANLAEEFFVSHAMLNLGLRVEGVYEAQARQYRICFSTVPGQIMPRTSTPMRRAGLAGAGYGRYSLDGRVDGYFTAPSVYPSPAQRPPPPPPVESKPTPPPPQTEKEIKRRMKF